MNKHQDFNSHKFHVIIRLMYHKTILYEEIKTLYCAVLLKDRQHEKTSKIFLWQNKKQTKTSARKRSHQNQARIEVSKHKNGNILIYHLFRLKDTTDLTGLPGKEKQRRIDTVHTTTQRRESCSSHPKRARNKSMLWPLFYPNDV